MACRRIRSALRSGRVWRRDANAGIRCAHVRLLRSATSSASPNRASIVLVGIAFGQLGRATLGGIELALSARLGRGEPIEAKGSELGARRPIVRRRYLTGGRVARQTLS